MLSPLVRWRKEREQEEAARGTAAQSPPHPGLPSGRRAGGVIFTCVVLERSYHCREPREDGRKFFLLELEPKNGSMWASLFFLSFSLSIQKLRLER